MCNNLAKDVLMKNGRALLRKGMPYSCVVAPPLEWCNRSVDTVRSPTMVAKQIVLATQTASISCLKTPTVVEKYMAQSLHIGL